MKRFSFTLILFCLGLQSLSLVSCAYFNTFYNTKKYFKEAAKEREKRRGDKPSSQEIQKYDKAIEKASKILELYPKSKYVDDAVMILGECFYYKGEYVKAQRKFQELITYFPKSKFVPEARLWLAKTDIELEDYLGAELALKDLEKSPKLKKQLLQEARLLMGDLLFKQKEYSEAGKNYAYVAENSKKGELRAKAYFKLGQTQLLTESFLDAVKSFQKAMRYSTDPRFSFEAELNYGIALKLAGDFKNSLRVCQGLLENSLLKEKHGRVKLEIADCIYREGKALYKKLKEANLDYYGKIEEAIEAYRKVILEHKRTPYSAQAYYQIARIYEEDYGDLVKAKENYEKVRQEYPRSEYVKLATEKAKNLGLLIKLRNELYQDQKIVSKTGKDLAFTQLSPYELLLLEQGNHPELRFFQKQKKLAQLHRQEQLKSAQASEDPQGLKEIDNIVDKKLQLAELYLFQFSKMDSAVKQYKEILEMFPNHPGCAKALYSLAFIYENEYLNKAATDSLLIELITRFPESYQAQEARKKLGLETIHQVDKVTAIYEKAEELLLLNKNPDQALKIFQEIVSSYPESEVAPKALYAIGWVYENRLFNNEKALETYRNLVNSYPKSKYAEKVKPKLRAVDRAVALKNKNRRPARPANSRMSPGKTLSDEKSDSTSFPKNETIQAQDNKQEFDTLKKFKRKAPRESEKPKTRKAKKKPEP